MAESIVFSGRIGEIVHTPQVDGRIFERYRRAPGVRLIIVSPEGKILLTREHRQESNSIDLRLPGGKVCDTIQAFTTLRESGPDILEAAKKAAIKEGMEETGLEIRNPELVTITHAGATVEWDLYYFSVRDYSELPTGQQLELGEEITVSWLSATEVRSAIADGQMQEWNSVGVLLGLVLPGLEALK